jgi:hypothetical protein
MRLGRKELETLRLALAAYIADLTVKGDVAYCTALLNKLSQPKEAAPLSRSPAAGVNVAKLQQVLVDHSGGRFVAYAGSDPGWWARNARAAGKKGVTEQQAEIVGKWLADQHWMTSGVTLADVLRKWEDWYAKANASQGPAASQSGAAGRRKAAW